MSDENNQIIKPIEIKQKDISFEELLSLPIEKLCDLLANPKHEKIHNKIKLIILIRYRELLIQDNIDLSGLNKIILLYCKLNPTEKEFFNKKHENIAKEISEEYSKRAKLRENNDLDVNWLR